MKKIALTGGIASGKTTVARRLQELGAIVVGSDEIGHQVIEPGKPAYEELLREFGPAILSAAGGIDRKRLGDMVFGQPEKLSRLNAITHPHIIEEMQEAIERAAREKPEGILVVEVPLLYESKLEYLFDEIWVVWANRDTQLKRLMERNGLSREEAEKRINSQMSLDEKARLADRVIDTEAQGCLSCLTT